jgi:hypothetical protein
VDNDVGAAGSTGRGEANLYGLCSFLIVDEMRRGKSPKDAIDTILQRTKFRNFVVGLPEYRDHRPQFEPLLKDAANGGLDRQLGNVRQRTDAADGGAAERLFREVVLEVSPDLGRFVSAPVPPSAQGASAGRARCSRVHACMLTSRTRTQGQSPRRRLRRPRAPRRRVRQQLCLSIIIFVS